MHFSSNWAPIWRVGGFTAPHRSLLASCSVIMRMSVREVRWTRTPHVHMRHVSELMQCSHVFRIIMRKVCSNSQTLSKTGHFWKISKFKSWAYVKTQEANKVISKNLNLFFFVKTKFIFCWKTNCVKISHFSYTIIAKLYKVLLLK